MCFINFLNSTFQSVLLVYFFFLLKFDYLRLPSLSKIMLTGETERKTSSAKSISHVVAF